MFRVTCCEFQGLGIVLGSQCCALGSHCCVFQCLVAMYSGVSVLFWGLTSVYSSVSLLCFRASYHVFQGLSEDECARPHKVF